MKIFLSHASVDKQLVRQIQMHLPSHISGWLDVDELGLGTKFPEQIRKQIFEECDFVIVFLGHNALLSEWVERELGWSLQRESELDRVFVLPVLLDDIWEQVVARFTALNERLYLQSFDRDPAAMEEAASKLADYLFAQLSRNIGAHSVTAPRKIIQEITGDLTSFKEVAFKLHAALGDSLAVLSTNQQAFDAVASAVDQYNVFTEAFIKRLPGYIEQVKSTWGRNLAEECADLMCFVEEEVYRGQVYALNRVRESIHRCSMDKTLCAADVQQLDADKNTSLDAVIVVLDGLTKKTVRLTARLEKEI